MKQEASGLDPEALHAGHSEVFERYEQIHDTEWVEYIESQTTVLEFVRFFIDEREHLSDLDEFDYDRQTDDDLR